jgi:hypothetical protein
MEITGASEFGMAGLFPDPTIEHATSAFFEDAQRDMVFGNHGISKCEALTAKYACFAPAPELVLKWFSERCADVDSRGH